MRPWIPLLMVAMACTPKTGPESAASGAASNSSEQQPAKSSVPLEERLAKAASLLGEAGGSETPIRQAMQILEQARLEAPGNGEIHLNLGIAHHMLGDLKAAEKAYQSAIGIDPDLGDAYLYLGEVARAEGRYESALANFRSGLRAEPEHLRLWEAEVAALREMGKPEQAIERAREGLKVNAFNLQLYNNLGLAYMDLEEYVLARFVFQKAQMTMEEAEKSAHITANMGWSYYLENDIPRALFWLEKARELDPELVSTRVYLAHIYMDDHNWQDALDELEVASGLDPENPAIQLNLGICYRGVERHDDARRAYEKALQLAPADPRPIFNLGVLYGDSLKSYDAAIQSFQDYIDKGGEKVELAQEYLKDVEREKTRVERKKKAEEERKKREQERLERQRLLEEAEKKQEAEEATAPAQEGEEAAPAQEGDAPEPSEGEGGEQAPADEGEGDDSQGVWE